MQENTLHLKGCASITVTKDTEVYVTASGTPALAKGGSGDVLSGIISSFLAQNVQNPVASASLLHGLAGRVAEEKFSSYSALAHNVVECIPTVIKKIIK